MPTPQLLTGTLYPGTPQEPYAYLPFDMPDGVTHFEATFSYEDGNIIDLGVLEPCFRPEVYPETQGFRGWSGGARDRFFITEAAATPGYLPGPLVPGTWQIMLGLYRVKAQGCSYRLELTFSDRPQPQPVPALATPKANKAPGWYPADLHTHTHYSDAKGSLDDLLRAAEARGLEVLAVTDHNTVSHHRALEHAQTPLLLLPGQEVTTSQGHANVWGEIGWADFRLRGDDDVAKLSDLVRERGGLLSLNHPKDTGYPWEYAVPERFGALEVWQSAWATRNWESLALANALIKEGRRFSFVGGSDRHQPGWPDPTPACLQVGTPTTWLYLEQFTAPAALEALRQGHVFISESPAGPHLSFTVSETPMGGTLPEQEAHDVVTTVTGAVGGTLRYLSDWGVVRETAITQDAFTDRWTWPSEGHFLRAEVIAEPEAGARETQLELAALGVTLSAAQLTEVLARPRLRALTNPVFVPGRSRAGRGP